MGKSDYAENKVLDLLNGKTAFGLPIAHVALFTSAPTDGGGGTEVSGGNYARVTTTGATWAAAVNGSTSNTLAIEFPTPSASWGLVTHYGVFDAPTAGNMLRWSKLLRPKVIKAGDLVSFAIGALTQSED